MTTQRSSGSPRREAWIVYQEWARDGGCGETAIPCAIYIGASAERKARRYAEEMIHDLRFGRGEWQGMPQQVFGHELPDQDEADWDVDVKVARLPVNPKIGSDRSRRFVARANRKLRLELGLPAAVVHLSRQSGQTRWQGVRSIGLYMGEAYCGQGAYATDAQGESLRHAQYVDDLFERVSCQKCRKKYIREGKIREGKTS